MLDTRCQMLDEDQGADGSAGRVKTVDDLHVFQKAYALSLQVHRTSLTFPQIEQYALGDQIRRASKSICANLAEGFGKQAVSRAEFKRFVGIALGSAEEMRVWIRYARDLGYIDPDRHQAWEQGYREVVRMLAGLWRKI